MPRVLRILNRLAVGGPVLNATYLTKFMAPDFETLLVVGEKEDHEQSAEYLAQQLGIHYVTIPGMGRSINPASDYFAYRQLIKLIRSYRPDIVHTHAAEGLADVACGGERIGIAVRTFRIHVDEAHLGRP
jgi:hypothetical protein